MEKITLPSVPLLLSDPFPHSETPCPVCLYREAAVEEIDANDSWDSMLHPLQYSFPAMQIGVSTYHLITPPTLLYRILPMYVSDLYQSILDLPVDTD